MPNLKTSIKDLRTANRRQVVNNRLRERIKRATKKQRTLVAQGNIEEGEKNLKNVYKVLDYLFHYYSL